MFNGSSLAQLAALSSRHLSDCFVSAAQGVQFSVLYRLPIDGYCHAGARDDLLSEAFLLRLGSACVVRNKIAPYAMASSRGMAIYCKPFEAPCGKISMRLGGVLGGN